MIIALDRCERNSGISSAIEEIKQQGINVYSLITAHDLIAYLEEIKKPSEAQVLRNYLGEFGVD